jgi:hypothetical protein
VILADYTTLNGYPFADIEDLLQINRKARDHIEAVEGARVAGEILERLPQDDAQFERMIREGYRLACHMSWDMVVRKYLLNDLLRAPNRQQKQHSCVRT